jgi:3-hydroxyacyl-CoA dehydrogenase
VTQIVGSVATLGGGSMCARIADAAGGLSVLIGESRGYLVAAHTQLENSLDGSVNRARLDTDKRDAALARVTSPAS